LIVRRAAIAACAAAAAACAWPAAAAANPCSRPAGKGGHQSFESGGTRRTALVHVPAGTPVGARLPVVLVFHGAGSDGPSMESYTGMSAVADREGFLAVYPSAVQPHPFWNYYGSHTKADDVGFVRDLIDRIERGRCVDQSRVYATGVSNGGGMVARIGCVLTSRLTAIAPVAGGYAHVPPCHPSRPLSVMEVHGTADATVPYKGTGSDHAGSARGYLSGWVDLDGCEHSYVRRTIDPGVERYDWRGCPPGIAVAHVKIHGGHHEWPGGAATGKPPHDAFSASWSVWRFFANLTA
jgi:polyhydroxybutyrate depolymerase